MSLQCAGTETLLSDCPHSTRHDCSAGEAAGVVCEEAGQEDWRNCLEYDISYRHSFNHLLDQVEAESPEDCQAQCLHHADCTHFSFNRNSSRSES